MEFDEAFEYIVKFEGGFVNDKDDSGGVTKYGISAKTYPNLDIASLGLDDAKGIYRHDFWDKLHLDSMPGIIRLALFDTAINCGPATSLKCLQQALGTPADGLIGPATLQRLDDALEKDAKGLLATLLHKRYERVKDLPSAPKFLNGWTDRMMKVIAYSL